MGQIVVRRELPKKCPLLEGARYGPADLPEAPAVIRVGDCVAVMAEMWACSVDAIVTDPPYGLEFMGQAWDRLDVPEASRSRGVTSAPGIGECPTSWVPYGGGDAANSPCACRGGRMRGGRRCVCEHPTWRVKGVPTPDATAHRREQARRMQAWHERWAREAYRVLKPGGYLLAFGGTRGHHRLMSGIEDAGFEIRDTLAWLHGSGFPKSLDVARAIDKAARGVPHGGSDPGSPNHGAYRTQATEGRRGARDHGRGYGAGPGRFMRQPGTRDSRELVEVAWAWQGWGTALKPAFEPIIVARKPLSERNVAANVLCWGTGGLHVDACRVPFSSTRDEQESKGKNRHADFGSASARNHVYGDYSMVPQRNYDAAGRWPANVVLDESAAATLDQQSGRCSVTGRRSALSRASPVAGTRWGTQNHRSREYPGDGGGASRFFYCAKASARERSTGLPDGVRNPHPTVKPVALMEWLLRLVTPPGGVVLDPFLGSGTTAVAATRLGISWVGIEQSQEYADVAALRVAAAHRHSPPAT